MRKSGIARTSSCFLAAGLWLATSVGFEPRPETVTATTPVENPTAATLPDYDIPAENAQSDKRHVEVIDLTVRNLEVASGNTRVSSVTLTDGFRPGSVDPTTVSAAAVARSQQWTLGDVFVESSEVTESGSVEYTLRASLRGDGARTGGTEVIAAVRAVSPEVSVLSESLHFVTKPGDELDSLSSDSVRIRVKGGLTFEPSMLRWTFMAVPSGAETKSAVSGTGGAASAGETNELVQLEGPAQRI